MKKAYRLGLIGTAFAAATACGIGAGISGSDRAKLEEYLLKNDMNCISAMHIDNANSYLANAKSNLTYQAESTSHVKIGEVSIPITNPAVYPTPLQAKSEMASAEKELCSVGSAEQAAKPIDNDLTNVVSSLKGVQKQLPDAKEAEKYNGASVDDSTFKSQRDAIEMAQGSIAAVKKKYLAMVPEEKNAEISWNKEKEVLYFLGGLVSGAFGLVLLLKHLAEK